ncbi:hypothetical protein U1Q18_049699, partial [Sarracenia purpurea var. burkii]
MVTTAITAVLYGISLALNLQISRAETPHVANFNQNEYYIQHLSNFAQYSVWKVCSNERLWDVRSQRRNLQENLQRLKAKSSLTIDGINYINIIGQWLSELQVREFYVRKTCPENAFKTHKTIKMCDGTAQCIISGDFVSADVQLLLTGDDYATYDDFIQKVYNNPNPENNKTSNFFQVINFLKFIINRERKYQMLNALYRVVRSNNDANVSKLIPLHSNLMTGIVDVPGTDKTASVELICKLWRENRKEAISVLSAALLNDDQWPTANKTKNDI